MKMKTKSKRLMARPGKGLLSMLLCLLLCVQICGVFSMPALAAGDSMTITIKKTWPDNNAADLPDSTTVALYSAEDELGAGSALISDTIELKKDENWTATVTDPDFDPALYYFVVDAPAPTGYINDAAPDPKKLTIETGLEWKNPTANLPFGSATYFSVISFGNYKANNADVESGLAVGGNFEAGKDGGGNYLSYSVGIPAKDTTAAVDGGDDYGAYDHEGGIGRPIYPHTPRMVVGGSITGSNLNIAGGDLYVEKDATITLGGINFFTAKNPSKAYTGNNFTSDNFEKTWISGADAKTHSSVVEKEGLDAFFGEMKDKLVALNEGYLVYKDKADGLDNHVLVVNTTYNYNDAPSGNYQLKLEDEFTGDYDDVKQIIYNVSLTETGPKIQMSDVEVSVPAGFGGIVVVNLIPTNGATEISFEHSPTGVGTNNKTLITEMHQDSITGDIFTVAREYSDRIIWNIPETVKTLTGNNLQLIGSVLAPRTDFVAKTGGNVNGCLIAGSVDVSAADGWEAHCTANFVYQAQTLGASGIITLSAKKDISTPATGSIEVTKVVQDSDGNTKTSFIGDFYVALFDGADGLTRTHTPEIITVTNGVSTTAEFTGLTAGDTYYVFEVDSASGSVGIQPNAKFDSYTVTYSDVNVIVVDSATPQTIQVINKEEPTTTPIDPGPGPSEPTPNPKPATVVLEAVKTVDGVKPAEGESFRFELRAAEDKGNAPIETKESNAAGKAVFSALSFEEIGTFVYNIREVIETGAFTYDETIYTVTVKVTKATDFVATVSYQKDGVSHSGALAFDNKSLTKEQVTTLQVVKQWAGPEGAVHPATAKVQLQKNGTDYGAPVVLSAANGWSYTWENLLKTETWTVKEVDIPADYTAFVSEADGVVTITNTTTTVNPTPTPKEKTPAELVLLTGKTLDGNKPGAARFSFVLSNAAGTELQVKQNDNEGLVIFDSLSFNAAGVYTFYLSERSGSVSVISYDSNAYKVEVTVTEAETGYHAVAAYFAADGSAMSTRPQFRNSTLTTTDTEETEIFELDENGVPFGKWVLEDGEWTFYELEENEIPLGRLPSTGDTFITAMCMLGALLLAAGWYLNQDRSDSKKTRNKE